MIPVIAAPTATGKTAAVLALAESLEIEVISADAMMVYQGMDIGTAKPSLAEQTGLPHHVIDVVTPDERFSVADFVPEAETKIAEVLNKGKLPVVVGGTGFYIEALVKGLPTTPPASEQVQAAFWQRFHKQGIEPLHQSLLALSPTEAERAQRNPRRVIRALEIIERTGKLPSDFIRSKPAFAYDVQVLLPELWQLEPRIAMRTEQMMADGLPDEVAWLMRQYPSASTARQAIGYKETIALLAGQASLAETKAAITLATRQYAKRQRTYFKRLEAQQVPALAEEALETLLLWLKGFV